MQDGHVQETVHADHGFLKHLPHQALSRALRSTQMSHDITIAFAGPFSWPRNTDVPCVYDVEEGRTAGIYLWTVPRPDHRLRCGNPQAGPIFATSVGTHISINNLLNRLMLPALNRCQHCGLPNDKSHLKQEHKFARDDRLPQWHGWHAARRGLGTNLYRLGVPDKVIQAILRHSNVSVTLGYYVKPQTQDVIAAMDKFEAEITAHNFRDSNGTVNPTPGAMPKAVN